MDMEAERRRSQRLKIDLPLQLKTGDGEYHDIELVDVSSTGMQILADNLTMLDRKSDHPNQLIEFEIRVVARLAWVKPTPDEKFALGMEFNPGDNESCVG